MGQRKFPYLIMQALEVEITPKDRELNTLNHTHVATIHHVDEVVDKGMYKVKDRGMYKVKDRVIDGAVDRIAAIVVVDFPIHGTEM